MDRQEEGVEAAAEEMEAGAEEMEARAEKLDERLDETRGEWRRKQHDPQVPGAQPTDEADDTGGAEASDQPDDLGGKAAGDGEGEGPAAQDAGQ